MGSVKSRISALEARQSHVVDDDLIDAAEYAANVLMGFVEVKSKSLSDVVQAMMKRGIDEADAKRFAEMGYSAAQEEVMDKLGQFLDKEKK